MATHNYENHAALEAAYSGVSAPNLPSAWSDGDIIRMCDLVYLVDTNYQTAATTVIPQYRGLVPQGDIKADHWNPPYVTVEDTSLDTTDGRYLPLPDDTNYDQTKATNRLAEAFEFCLTRGLDLDCGENRVYGLAYQLVWGKTQSVTPYGAPTLLNTNLVWMGATSTAVDNSAVDDPDEWTFGPAALVVGKAADITVRKYPVAVDNVRVDGRRLRNPIHFMGCEARPQKFRAERGVDYEAQIGRNFEVGDGTPGGYTVPSSGESADGYAKGDEDSRFGCTDCKFEGRGRHYSYGEYADGTFETGTPTEGSGWWGMTGRTSAGLVVRSSDVELDVTFATGRHALIAGAGWNQSYQNSKFWLVPDTEMYNGGVGAANATTKRAVIVTKRCKSYDFTGGRSQDGLMDIHSPRGRVNLMNFDQAPHAPVRMNFYADSANYTKFSMIGCAVSTTSGSVLARDAVADANYTGDYDGAFHGNVTDTGDTLKVCGYETIMGGFRHSGNAFKEVNANVLSVQRTDQPQKSMIIQPASGSEPSTGFPASANFLPVDGNGNKQFSDQLAFDFSTGKWRVGYTDNVNELVLS